MVVAAELVGVPARAGPAGPSRSCAGYIASVRPELRCTPAAAESMAYLLDPPGLDEDIAEIWQDIRDGAVASLPDWALRDVRLPRAGAADPGPPGTRSGRHSACWTRCSSASQACWRRGSGSPSRMRAAQRA